MRIAIIAPGSRGWVRFTLGASYHQPCAPPVTAKITGERWLSSRPQGGASKPSKPAWALQLGRDIDSLVESLVGAPIRFCFNPPLAVVNNLKLAGLVVVLAASWLRGVWN